jgi:hypothetical protein
MVFVAVAGYVAAADFGYIKPVWEMEGSMIVATAGIVAGIAGFLAAGKIEDLLPDDEGIYIIAFRSSDDTGGEIWEISEDHFENMTVHGSLFEWPVGKRVYEVLEYRPSENVAVGNWRESVAGSSIADHYDVPDAMEQIETLRSEFEPEAQKSRRLQRRIRSIVRKLDRRRLEDQQEILDPTTNPSFDRDDATVSAVVEEEIPDDLRPDGMRNEPDEPDTDEEIVGFDLLDDEEPLEREN